MLARLFTTLLRTAQQGELMTGAGQQACRLQPNARTRAGDQNPLHRNEEDVSVNELREAEIQKHRSTGQVADSEQLHENSRPIKPGW